MNCWHFQKDAFDLVDQFAARDAVFDQNAMAFIFQSFML